jgi:hypothetical protein
MPMNIDEEIHLISDKLIYEIVTAFGLPGTENWCRRLRPLLRKATENLSRIGLTFDRLIAEFGFPKAAAWSITHWCRDILVRGRDNIPAEGPLVVVSNHPGAYDALVIAAQLPRPDLRIIASDLPFLRAFNNISERIFFIPINKMDTARRSAGMLSAVRYLKSGGAVLLMGSGTIDPDPAVYPGALKHLQRWTEATSMFLRFVPQARLMLTAISHIVSPKWAYHPLTWLQRGLMEKRRVAEFGQVLQQLFFPESLYVCPRLSFAPILTSDQLGDSPRDILVEREAALLMEHCREFGGQPS